jgi:hypothetical protein
MSHDPTPSSPVIDEAKAKAITWLRRPDNDDEKMVFSDVGAGVPFIMSSLTQIYDYVEQLLTAKINEENPRLFKLDPNVKNSQMRALFSDLLLLSPAQQGKRALLISDMIKNMNRPQFNPMAMLAGLGQNRESDEELIEEVPAPE